MKNSFKHTEVLEGKKAAFTLAEVLITLGVIGVVAAVTMPTLIAKFKEKQTVTAVKEAYSIFSQAYLRVVNEYDSLENLVDSNATQKENATRMFQELSKYLKKVKSCDVDNDCMGDVYINLTGKSLNRSWDNFANVQTGVLPNGISFWVLSGNNAQGNFSGQLGIDINGKKRPNQLGVDFFIFYIEGNGKILPGGSAAHYNNYKNLSMYTDGRFTACNIDGDYDYNYNGYACTAWILEHENMDYLKRNISNEE